MRPTTRSASPQTAKTPAAVWRHVTNIFVAPGDVFDELLAAPRSIANWLVPLLLVNVVGVAALAAFVHLPFFQPRMKSMGMYQLRENATENLIQSWHAEWDLRDEYAREMTLLGGSITIVVSTFAGAYWSALVLWGLARALFQTRLDFMKVVELTAATGVILGLGTIVTILLVLATGNASIKPALGPLNLFELWSAAALATALARVTAASFGEAAFWVFVYWIALKLLICALSVPAPA